MKLRELYESPYFMGGEYKNNIAAEWYPSLPGLHRGFQHLAELTLSVNEVYNLWLSNDNSYAIITIEAQDPTARELGQRQRVVTKITFDNRSNLPVPKELQVELVHTHSNYQHRFLAGMLYILLARYGFSIISDFTQYLGGQTLWKKIASMAESKNYSVFIWSDENGDWLRDDAGEPIKYNAANVGDDEIWQDISQHHLSTTLFCLQHGSTLKTL